VSKKVFISVLFLKNILLVIEFYIDRVSPGLKDIVPNDVCTYG
jgi:hypothetical protein